MADWLHCNTCYKQPGDGRGFFLTNCGHLYCEGCQNRGWTENCLLCGTRKPSALKLTSKLTPPVDSYFSDPIKMLKQISTEIKRAIATVEFQHHQRRRYVSQLQKIVKNQREIVERNEKELKAKIRVKLDSMERSPSSVYDKNRYNNSPVLKGFGSPVGIHQMSRCASLSSVHKKISPGPGMTMVTSSRVSVRTPPSGGKMGVIPQSTPSPLNFIPKCTPSLNGGEKVKVPPLSKGGLVSGYKQEVGYTKQ